MRFPEAVRRRPSGWRGAAEASAGQHYGDANFCAVELAFVHVCYCALGRLGGGVEDVCGAAVCVEGFVQRHIEVGDWAVGGEYFGQVSRSDVFGQLFDYDLLRKASCELFGNVEGMWGETDF